MKHTKGEWFVATDNNVYSQHGDARIAIVEADFNISEQEAEANARLIAAAPELLEALQILLKSHRQLTFNANHSLSDSPIEEMAANAIKKAKGE